MNGGEVNLSPLYRHFFKFNQNFISAIPPFHQLRDQAYREFYHK